jgi:hypothetical protein
MGFRQFTLLFQCIFAAGGGPWMAAGWMRRWLESLAWELEMQKPVLPYRYGADGDFGGGETLVIDGETWVLSLGAGECSLSRSVRVESEKWPDHPGCHRMVRWIDLRGEKQLKTDERVIKLSRRKQELRWYAELPGLSQFFEGVPLEMEVRAVRDDRFGSSYRANV